MNYYIKERHNPQTGVYYMPLGKLSKKKAKEHEKSLYGFNIILVYPTEEEYKKAVEKHKKFNKA